jgi:ferritin-like metal-binding protein YciE
MQRQMNRQKTTEDLHRRCGAQPEKINRHACLMGLEGLVSRRDLKAGLKSHAIDTQNQIERLDKVFAKLGKQPKAPTARPSTA